MSSSSQPHTGLRTSPRHSLSWRLTVAIILIGVAVMVVFGWAARRQVEMSLLRAGGERAQRVVADVADIFARSMRQSRVDLSLLASSPDLRAFVENPVNAQYADGLRLRLNAVPIPGIRRVEIWTDQGARLLEIVRKSPNVSSADALPPASLPTTGVFVAKA